MKKKNNGDIKILLVLLAILLICFGIIGYMFYKYFYAGTSTTKYGDRLEGIENYKLSNTLEKDIQSVYEKTTSVDTVKVKTQGKIIYIDIAFKTAIKVDTAKSEAIKALDKIGEENLKYYDVQFVLTYTGEDENSNFSIFISKIANSLKVIW